MRLKRIRAKNYKKIMKDEIGFDSGLNIIYAENESGKSTLCDAILDIFYEDVSSKSKRIDALQSWGATEMPILNAEISDNNGDYLLTKDFNTHSLSLRNQEGKEMIQKKQVEAWIEKVSGIKNRDTYALTAMITQDEMALAGSDMKKLQESIEGKITDTGKSNPIQKVMTKVKKDIDELDKGRFRPALINGAIRILEDKIQDQKQHVQAITAQLQKRQSSSKAGVEASDRINEITPRIETISEVINKSERYVKIKTRENELSEVVKEYDDRVRRIERLQESIKDKSKKLSRIKDYEKIASVVQNLRRLSEDADVRREDISNAKLKLADLGNALKKYVSRLLVIGIALNSVLAVAVFAAPISQSVLSRVFVVACGFIIFAVIGTIYLSDRREKYSRMKAELLINERKLDDYEKKIGEIVKSSKARSADEILQKYEDAGIIIDDINGAQKEITAILGKNSVEEIEKKLSSYAKEIVLLREEEKDYKNSVVEGDKLIELKKELASLESERVKLERTVTRGSIINEIGEYTEENLLEAEELLESFEEEYQKQLTRSETLKHVLHFIDEARATLISSGSHLLREYMEKYLSLVTNDRYQKVRVENDLTIQVFSNEKKDWVSPDVDLSRGTIDQIYLIARLALIEMMCKGKSPILILDDPFVTFDEIRLVGVKKLLDELAKDKQILLFTCHKEYLTWGHAIKLR